MRKSKKESQLVFIKNLSNEELMDELSQFGENPGPINSLTRSVYERKLAKLMEEEGESRWGQGLTLRVQITVLYRNTSEAPTTSRGDGI